LRVVADLQIAAGGVIRVHAAGGDPRVAFRKKLYANIEALQLDLDGWIKAYNEEGPHQNRWCLGKTPMQTFQDAKPVAKEKLIHAA
jgi:hypothetical protein